MKLVESLLTKNPCYTNWEKMKVRGFMLHSVGCPQPNAMVFINSWNSPYYGTACVHGFIDANDGTAYQTLPWDHAGWHAASGPKGSANNTHIGVEMCEPACISYNGISVSCSNLSEARKAVARTYNTAVELCAMLCQKYGLDPEKPGVVISHKEGCTLGIASNHGDPEHLWTALNTPYTMDTFRRDVAAKMGAPTYDTKLTNIMGKTVATAVQMQNYLKKVNPTVSKEVMEMLPFYISEGQTEGVRGDIAFAQSCLETGNFGFGGGTAVTLDQNNFCGMGVTKLGLKGNSFATPQLGIRAQIQHLKAYASDEVLHNECVDPRFQYVKRKTSEYVEWLGIPDNPNGVGWAGGAGYGAKILEILSKVLLMEGKEIQNEGGEYAVRVAIDNLNIRTGPGTNYSLTGLFTGAGSFTITDTKEGKGSAKGWGKLKSGAGWIALDFAEKVKR